MPNTSAAEILRPSRLLLQRYLTLFRPIKGNKDVGIFLILTLVPSKITINKLGKVSNTYPKRLVHNQTPIIFFRSRACVPRASSSQCEKADRQLVLLIFPFKIFKDFLKER